VLEQANLKLSQQIANQNQPSLNGYGISQKTWLNQERIPLEQGESPIILKPA
jgi:hypothetical protein